MEGSAAEKGENRTVREEEEVPDEETARGPTEEGKRIG